jgi:hypothetical protein
MEQDHQMVMFSFDQLGLENDSPVKNRQEEAPNQRDDVQTHK